MIPATTAPEKAFAPMDADAFRARLALLRRRVDEAAARAGRDAAGARLVAVSKTHPVELIELALTAGATDFGENRVQEADEKIARLGQGRARWHLIGHLQANKARRAVRLFDVIHTVDSAQLVARLERLCAEEGRESLDALIQIDLAGEETKEGVPESDLPPVIEAFAACRHVRLVGLMTLPPYFEDAERVRPFFHRLRELRDELATQGAFYGGEPGELSMGMSHDFEVAVEEGATLVRVGTALFGERPRR